MNSSSERLLHLLAVQPAEGPDQYRGSAGHETHVRAFGGQILGQALAALVCSVSKGRSLHSFHSYFLRPVRVERPLNFALAVVREGRSFTNKSLEATQDAKTVFTASASFHDEESGNEHSAPFPELSPPEDSEPFEVRYAGRQGIDDMGRWFHRVAAFDIRYPGPTAFEESVATTSAFWVRLRPSLADFDYPGSALQAAVVGYLSDLAVLDPILMAHRVRWTDAPVIGASLDHALWFHRPFDVNQWLLFSHHSPASGGGRGLAIGSVYQHGEVVASVVQEALLRPPGRRST